MSNASNSLAMYAVTTLDGLGMMSNGGEVAIQITSHAFDAGGSVFNATLPSLDAARDAYRRLSAGVKCALIITPLRPWENRYKTTSDYYGMPVIFSGTVGA